jgi:hypothetical protein
MLSMTVNEKTTQRSVIALCAVVVALLWSLFIIEIDIANNVKVGSRENCSTNDLQYSRLRAKVKPFNDYTAFYIFEGANVILVDKKPTFSSIHFDAEELVTITNFTHKCLLCDHRELCPYLQSPLTLRLSSRDPKSLLSIPSFIKCQLPDQCFWFGRQFNCKDLVELTRLTT